MQMTEFVDESALERPCGHENVYVEQMRW